jgi:hypothetical protein
MELLEVVSIELSRRLGHESIETADVSDADLT